MKRVLLSILFLLAICFPSVPSLGSTFEAEQMISATDVTTTQISRWVQGGRHLSVIECLADVTAIAGGGTLRLKIEGCLPQNVVADGCTDGSDTISWYADDAVSTVTTSHLILTPMLMSSAIGGWDEKTVGPVPAVWMIEMSVGATVTASYTVDCVWW